MAYCRKCRTRIPDGTVICPYCEAPQQDQSIYLNSSTRSSSQNSEQSFSSGSLIFISIALSILGLMGLIVPPKGLILSIPCFALVIASIVSIVKRNRKHQEMIENMSRAASKNSAPVTQKPAAPTKTWSFADANSVSARPMNQTTASRPKAKTETASSGQSKLNDTVARLIFDCTIKYNAEREAAGLLGIHNTTISFKIGDTFDEDERVQHLKEKVLETTFGHCQQFWANITIDRGDGIYVTITMEDIIASRYSNLPTLKDIKGKLPIWNDAEGKPHAVYVDSFIIPDVHLVLTDSNDTDAENDYFTFVATTVLTERIESEQTGWVIQADKTEFDWLFTALKKENLLGNIIVWAAAFLESSKNGIARLANLEIDRFGDGYVNRI